MSARVLIRDTTILPDDTQRLTSSSSYPCGATCRWPLLDWRHRASAAGKGFDVARLGRWRTLRSARVHYWGDLDTHGLAILHRLRTHLPHVESFLMDSKTLHAHRDRWGRESTPTSASLDRLTAAEAAVYDDLVSDRFAEQVRLEQERIDWAWTLERLPYATSRNQLD